MKRKWICLCIVSILLLQAFAFSSFAEEAKVSIYVSQNGNDQNNGSKESPFGTVERAQQAAREQAALGNADVEVVIGAGTYVLDQTLEFDERDSGKNGHRVTYRGENYPLISGGKRIEGFEQMENGMWKAYAPDFEFIRELYVNDTRVYRASSEREITGLGNYDDPKTAYTYDGFYFDKDVLPVYAKADQVEMRLGVGWKVQNWLVEKIIPDPENSERTIAIMKQPYFNFQASVPHWGHAARYDIGFRVENAMELLDQPGEYYFDVDTKELFYLPRETDDLKTAVVYAPVLEQLMNISGDCGETAEYVENLHFNGIRFAHAAFNNPEEMGYAPGQSSSVHICNRIEEFNGDSSYPGAINIYGAKNCSIENCVFFGTGGAAIRLLHSLDSFVVNGNAIYDTGETGIIVGQNGTKTLVSEGMTKPEGYRYNMIYKSDLEFSGFGDFGNSNLNIRPGDGAAWTPINDVAAGVKSYYKLSFDEPVAIDEVRLKTVNSEGDYEQKRNFEILVSNDENFETYKILHKQGPTGYGPAELSVKPNDAEKYQYLLIRKTAVEAFSITDLYVYTYDIPWEARYVPQNVTLSNNYITRVANYYYSGHAIQTYYTEDLTVEHNEVYRTPYSGMAIGWGWSASTKNILRTKVYNNKVDTYNMELNDGGGIYFISRQEGSEFKGNYIKNEKNPFGAAYFDNGSGGWTVTDNVMENCTNAIFNWDASLNDGFVIQNTYSDINFYDNSGKNSIMDPIIVFPSGNPTPEAQKIIDNAGLQPEYIGIKKLVPEGDTYFGNRTADNYSATYGHYGDVYDRCTVPKKQRAAVLMKETVCGTLPGQYSAYAWMKLSERNAETDATDRVNDGTGAGSAERDMRLAEAIEEYKDSLIRLPLAETVKIAKELDTEGAYTKQIDEIVSSDAAEYDKVYAVENIIAEIDSKKTNAQLLGVKIPSYDSEPVFDGDQVYITVDDSVLLQNVKLDYLAKGTVTPDLTKGVDGRYPVQVVVKNGTDIRLYTLHFVKEQNKTWWNWYGETVEHNILRATENAYMNSIPSANVTLKLRTQTDTATPLRVIFASDKYQVTDVSNDANCMALDIYKDQICLTKLIGGKKTVIYGRKKSENALMNTMVLNESKAEDIDLEIRTQKQGNNLLVVVRMNGKTVINALCEGSGLNANGYYGLYSKAHDIEIRG